MIKIEAEYVVDKDGHVFIRTMIEYHAGRLSAPWSFADERARQFRPATFFADALSKVLANLTPGEQTGYLTGTRRCIEEVEAEAMEINFHPTELASVWEEENIGI